VQALISIQQTQDLLFSYLPVLDGEQVELDQSFGRILAEPITADRAIPPYDRVMMDGIAIRYENFVSGQREFAVTGIQAAGMPTLTLEDPTECIEVMTGGVLPENTDCVIKIEDIRLENGIAHLSSTCPAQSGQHIHPHGSDQESGALLVYQGHLIGPPEIAIAASVGQTNLTVTRLPKILLITTGDEVIPPAHLPLAHQIRRSHYPAIRASIESKQLGLVVNIHVPDTRESLENAVSDGLKNADLILLTGGISMGKYDYVAPVLESLVGAPIFHGVAQRPGKPFAFWSGEKPVFALPGNPASVMACLARYVIPALRKMRGEDWKPESFPLAHETIWNAPLPGLLASYIFQNQLHTAPPRNSGDYTALAGAEGICELPSTSPSGKAVHFYPW